MRFALALLGLFFCTELNAAAWTLDQGHGQILNNFSLYGSDRYIDADGHSVKTGSYTKLEYNPYMEYGITPALTIGLSPSFQYVVQKIAGLDEDNYNLADTDLFLRQRLYSDGQNVIAIQPLVKLPGPYDTSDVPVLGQGQIDYELRLLYGRNFGLNGRHYLDAEVAYRVRTETPGDEWRVDFGLGYRLNDDWQLLGQVQGIFAADGPGSTALLLSNSYDYDLVKLQLSTIYSLSPQWALQFGLFHDVYERNTGEGGGALVSVWYRF